MDVHSELRTYLSDNLFYVDDDFTYDNDASFIQGGLIDSMGIMELVTYVQGHFQVKVNPEDVSPDNFDSVNKLAGFIERRRLEEHVPARWPAEQSVTSAG